jgi:hypothetical protein
MKVRGKLSTRAGACSVRFMEITQRRSPARAPAGCEAHLTRKQAAALLGLKSEFKIRQFERDGVLRSVRGAMRTAYYARGDILALKARMGAHDPRPTEGDAWSDAELLALLAHPRADGTRRTAVDLVLEANIAIERAERVIAFWTQASGTQAPAREPSVEQARSQGTATGRESAKTTATDETAQERRSDVRREHDDLIRQLRDPDPKVRDQAFARLKQTQAGRS